MPPEAWHSCEIIKVPVLRPSVDYTALVLKLFIPPQRITCKLLSRCVLLQICSQDFFRWGQWGPLKLVLPDFRMKKNMITNMQSIKQIKFKLIFFLF